MSFFKNKQILVTGGTGFIGINLLRRLIGYETKIRATFHRVKPVIFDKAIEYLPCDLTDLSDCLKATKGVDMVFHCAASTSGAASIEKNPLIHVTPNIVMNAQLLEAAHMHGVQKFLWLGSSTGYPPTEDRKVKEEEMMEGDPYDKYYCVGWMKRYSEILCRIYAEKIKSRMLTIILRPTNIYGDYDDFEFETSHMLAALIRRVVERMNPIEVWGTGDDVRDLVYVEDFTEAMVLAMEKMNHFEPINIGLGKGYSVKEIIHMICEIDQYTGANIVFNKAKPTTIPIRLVDITKAEQLLGFRPKTDLREGIKKTIDWYKSNRLLKKELN